MVSTDSKIKINFVGDVCLHNIETRNLHVDDFLKSIFENSDLNIANLEGPLTNSECKDMYHPIYLKSKLEKNHILDMIDIFSLANNHILDYKLQGLEDTMNFLQSYNKRYFGAGINETEALRPLLLNIKGIKLAFLGFTRWNRAKGSMAGAAPNRVTRLKKILHQVKRDGYFAVVYPHWNYEYIYYPAPDNRRLAKQLIDAGADLIVGSHPHIIQGYEQRKGRYIFHSLGNFVFHPDEYHDVNTLMYDDVPRIDRSYILSIEICKNNSSNYSYTIIPISSNDKRIEPLDGLQLKEFETKMKSISHILTTEFKYRKIFYRHAVHISNKSVGVLKMVRTQQGIRSMLMVLSGINKQDFKIWMYSIWSRIQKGIWHPKISSRAR